uniref:F-box domain-containing protein n=1 Tax=Kalanchoe fedtschenkoi TaxID=63787 RepID=A0A7N1A5Y0_KALFE
MTASDGDEETITAALHSDILRTHILSRLDGPTLASLTCSSSHLRDLIEQDEALWRRVSVASWPSISHPLVQELVSSFPARHRSLFTDSHPLLTHRPSLHGLVSAVDLYYDGKPVLSRVVTTDATRDCFRTSPFHVDVPGSDESGQTPITDLDFLDDELAEKLSLSWILIDPARKKSANMSSLFPVSVQRHWMTNNVHVRFETIVAGLGGGSAFAQCSIEVTLVGRKEEEGFVRAGMEVKMVVEDMEGRSVSGEESLLILGMAVESGERRRVRRGDEQERYRDYMEMKRQRRAAREKKERAFDILFVAVSFCMFVSLWFFLLSRKTRS